MSERNYKLELEEMELVASQLRLMLDQAYDEIKRLKSFRSAVDELIAVYDDALPF